MTTEDTIQYLADQRLRIAAMFDDPDAKAKKYLDTIRREDTPMVGGRRHIDPIGEQA